MARKIYKPEEIVNLLRQVEVAVANGKSTPVACKEAGVVEQSVTLFAEEIRGDAPQPTNYGGTTIE